MLKKTKKVEVNNDSAGETKKGLAKKEWKAFIEQSKGLERDYMAEIVQSRKHWQYLALACFLFACAAVLYHQFNPVTKTEPHVLRVDNTTGAVDIVSTVKEQETSYGEIVDKYFIAEYIKSYESYNYYSIQSDYDKTILMSSDQVADDYMKIFDSTAGKEGRDVELGELGSRQVNIISIVPNTDNGSATVRFETLTESDRTGAIIENWTAALTYEYVATSIDNDIRLLNPLGFVVTSYRVDKEIN